ncbi:MAG: DEAD/DEAH box helicase family protein [Caldilineaceae bacterium]|nr:DEAD/DEAH box helicase family protein [Caldilineaceae bacterium]
MLIDNKNHGKVAEELAHGLTPDSRLAILSGLFSIYGYSALKKELSHTRGIRLLLSNWVQGQGAAIAGSVTEQRLKNALDQKRIARDCLNWMGKDVEVKAFLGMIAPTQNMFHIDNGEDGAFAIQGSSHFTAVGLGTVKSPALEMNMGIREAAVAGQLLHWFDTLWNDASVTRDIKQEVERELAYLAADQPGRLVYFLTLYHLFQEILDEIDEEKIIRSKTGFKDTVVWNKLYKFQRDGVLGAIDKLEKYNGCIIADSVGLGKTFEGLAVIKYYELRNDRVLVLCPKKLRDNWTVYTVNDKRNLLAADRFNYDVLNHTDLSRERGRSGEINLETLNWGNYDLVVIDESHNFRNNETKTTTVTRYSRLMEQIIRSGVKTKVLMLSATPVNSRMNDLKNQVAFITEGTDSALADYGIPSIENTLRRAQTRFNQWLKLEDRQRTTASLLEALNFDYFKLLDLFTIARSRKHIEKYYDSREIGKFPERLKPKNFKADIDLTGAFPPLKEINLAIRRLNLSAYAPLEYVRLDKKEEYSRKYDQTVKSGSVLRQVDRERSLIHLMRVNMLKRMESSINSFALTVEKILGQIDDLIARIDAHSEGEFEELSIEEVDTESPEFDDYLIGNKVKVLIQDIDRVRWRQDLQEDREHLAALLVDARAVDAARDAKLARLKQVISDKLRQPVNAGNRKVIIFTAFADTASYLYQEIASWAAEEHGLHSALVRGAGSNQSTMKGISKDLNSILTHFSPVSKEREKVYPDIHAEIDILIATDCISEGQNLQDCDYLINYDIHWNPVRIIQRFGRIDRLGSRNSAIQLANFWPNMELDEYINLEARVSGRMVLLDISATGEENVIEYDEKKQMNDLDYRRRQMKQLQETVIDLEDMEGSVSITDMTLNDFRMDLSVFMKEHLELLEQSPSGFYAVNMPSIAEEIVPGAIFCLRDIHDKVQHDVNYALAPYYLVYVADDGEIVFNHLQGKKSLDIFKKLCAMQESANGEAEASLAKATRQHRDMGHYQFLLERAIGSIVGKTEEKGVESLFSRGGTVLTQDHFHGLEDFEVVSYLILLGDMT